jgi:hypothetical protein
MFAACAAFAFVAPPVAGDLLISKAYADGSAKGRAKMKAHRGARVKGFVQRGGYYSYVDEDAINSYAWSRSLFTSTSTFRNPWTERQSAAGPFDSGFFFDSGLIPNLNDAPYPR